MQSEKLTIEVEVPEGPVEFPLLRHTNQVAPALLILETTQEESKRLAMTLMEDGHTEYFMGKQY